ncbi:RHS repeat-associated core domain-containing protein [Eubacteriales bacterium OttesenSCG-928-N13]|nr:RHS repeat-associated core domain-containing protein [Eubacteriales bacterium OttesenSCG-928-N13]
MLTSYAYDKLGQLTRVNDPHESATWVYDYDCGGNILSKKKYAYTTGAPAGTPASYAYTYANASWKDQLTSYNGKAITYDAIGNPLTYDGWTYTWEKGRQLKKMVKGSTTIEYAYDVAGLRIQKKVNGVATDYTLHSKLVIVMKTGNDTLHFFYDAQSRPNMVKYGEVYYSYQNNLQGDIIGIVDATGNKVVEYAYDAWGRPISTTGSMATTLGKLNPFRYRHYQHDEETAYYYLRSRYYNPEWGRFINEDSTYGKRGELLSHNMFAYCQNDPMNSIDPSGKEGKLQWQSGTPTKLTCSMSMKAYRNTLYKITGYAPPYPKPISPTIRAITNVAVVGLQMGVSKIIPGGGIALDVFDIASGAVTPFEGHKQGILNYLIQNTKIESGEPNRMENESVKVDLLMGTHTTEIQTTYIDEYGNTTQGALFSCNASYDSDDVMKSIMDCFVVDTLEAQGTVLCSTP